MTDKKKQYMNRKTDYKFTNISNFNQITGSRDSGSLFVRSMYAVDGRT